MFLTFAIGNTCSLCICVRTGHSFLPESIENLSSSLHCACSVSVYGILVFLKGLDVNLWSASSTLRCFCCSFSLRCVCAVCAEHVEQNWQLNCRPQSLPAVANRRQYNYKSVIIFVYVCFFPSTFLFNISTLPASFSDVWSCFLHSGTTGIMQTDYKCKIKISVLNRDVDWTELWRGVNSRATLIVCHC